MKARKVLRIPFPIEFIFKIDSKLQPFYCKQLQRDRIFILLYLIQTNSYMNYNCDVKYKYAPIMSKDIKLLIGLYYQNYISILLKHNIIETDNLYIVGKKAKYYWISNDLISHKLIKYCNFPHMLEVKPTMSLQYYRLPKYNHPTNRSILYTQHKILTNIRINYNEACKYFNNKYNITEILSIQRLIFEINLSEIFTQVTTSNYFSSYTVLPSRIKRKIKINNEKSKLHNFENNYYKIENIIRDNISIFTEFNKIGIVYKATNVKTNKSYIGQTSKTLEERKNAHFTACKYSNTKFYVELKTSNKNDWVWDIIDTDLLICLNKKETQYIMKFNTIESGYNTTPGGDNSNIISNLTYLFTKALLIAYKKLPILISMKDILYPISIYNQVIEIKNTKVIQLFAKYMNISTELSKQITNSFLPIY